MQKMVAGSGHYQSVGCWEKGDLLQLCWLLESHLSLGKASPLGWGGVVSTPAASGMLSEGFVLAMWKAHRAAAHKQATFQSCGE